PGHEEVAALLRLVAGPAAVDQEGLLLLGPLGEDTLRPVRAPGRPRAGQRRPGGQLQEASPPQLHVRHEPLLAGSRARHLLHRRPRFGIAGLSPSASPCVPAGTQGEVASEPLHRLRLGHLLCATSTTGAAVLVLLVPSLALYTIV